LATDAAAKVGRGGTKETRPAATGCVESVAASSVVGTNARNNDKTPLKALKKKKAARKAQRRENADDAANVEKNGA
jgi:hypothetical protein